MLFESLAALVTLDSIDIHSEPTCPVIFPPIMIDASVTYYINSAFFTESMAFLR